jgi:hypothetical protein
VNQGFKFTLKEVRSREIDFDELDVSDQPLLGQVPGPVRSAAEDCQD